jgi:hypothetical protein
MALLKKALPCSGMSEKSRSLSFRASILAQFVRDRFLVVDFFTNVCLSFGFVPFEPLNTIVNTSSRKERVGRASDKLSCSRNARPPKALVGRAQSRVRQTPFLFLSLSGLGGKSKTGKGERGEQPDHPSCSPRPHDQNVLPRCAQLRTIWLLHSYMGTSKLGRAIRWILVVRCAQWGPSQASSHSLTNCSHVDTVLHGCESQDRSLCPVD